MFEQDLILVGGGHSHVLVLKNLMMNPIAGVRVTLVSDRFEAPYSGMLPGYVAGHYAVEETVIDLNRLCLKVGARWIHGHVTSIKPDENEIEIKDQPSLKYDCVSIDTGSQPNGGAIPGSQYATAVKPVAAFHQQWQRLQELLTQSQAEPRSNDVQIGVIGGGVGGVELCLALAHRLDRQSNCATHLLFRGDSVLSELPAKASRVVSAQLQAMGVVMHSNFDVSHFEQTVCYSKSGASLTLDFPFLCTEAGSPSWLAEGGLHLSEAGFIDVNHYLQSTSHKNVFAAGDVADMNHIERPKAGVFAVRQAPFLAENLRRFFSRSPLKPVKLQRDFLRLISLGERRAVAVKNGLTVSGSWVWRWKDWIDRRFIDQFEQLPSASMDVAAASSNNLMHCAGCGSKLGPQLLKENLQQLPDQQETSVTAAVHIVEDATVWQPPAGTQIVQSVDGFRSFSTDHYRFGQIAVHHALNDLYAMGAQPIHAQAWVNLAFSHPRIQKRDHLRLMQGVSEALHSSGAVLAGGHSTEGVEDHLGVVVNGILNAESVWRKAGAQVGDGLVLNKALGTGVVLAADAALQAPASAVEAAMEHMLMSNSVLFAELLNNVPNAVTDVSGFGLLGHLLEMLEGDSLGAELILDNIPILPGALKLAAEGHASSLKPSLLHYLASCVLAEGLDSAKLDLLLDPQTSGGLLVAMPMQDAEKMLEENSSLRLIGTVTELTAGTTSISIV